MLVNGVLVANNSVMLDVPFEVLRASHLVRARAVVIDGSNYRCRLLRTDNDENDADEWDQALIATGANRKLWNLYDNEPFWTVSPHGMEVRGGHGDPEGRYAWRPVLELARKPDFQKLEVGQKLLCWGWQSLVNGILLENGTYDLVLQRQDGTDISPKDTATFASPAMDDQVIVNKSAVAGLRRKEK